MTVYPKRLIEVDLPIRRISDHARREKSSRQGHISMLHIWWARRPLAACRAVICAALWPDPADALCPDAFRLVARQWMSRWSKENLGKLSEKSYQRFIAFQKNPEELNKNEELRGALLDFIADFADPDNSTVREFLETSRALTLAAHEALGGVPGTRPLVVDPFAGGGSIPLEALRVGAEAFASDINPIAAQLNKIILEYVPKYGQRLADDVRKWGEWIKRKAEKGLAEFYPKDPDGATPIAYLWARTIQCEGPGCGVQIPILLKRTLCDKPGLEAAIAIEYSRMNLHTMVVHGKDAKSYKAGTNRRSSVTCPACGFTTMRRNVEKQANSSGFGYHLLAVCYRKDGKTRFYRQPTARDLRLVKAAEDALAKAKEEKIEEIPLIPTEELPYLRSIFNVRVYAIDQWCKLFHSRQLLSAARLVRIVRECAEEIRRATNDQVLAQAITECVALAVSNSLQFQCNITTYPNERAGFISAFIQGQSLPMKMDFVEVNPLVGGLAGGLKFTIDQHVSGLESIVAVDSLGGSATSSSALKHVLPSDSADCLVTDPPYYDLIPFADCSDFFYVWLRRMLIGISSFSTSTGLVPKGDEIAQLAERNERYCNKTKQWFEERMSDALANMRDVVRPGRLGVVLFAHKETAAWEAMLQSVLNAGWIVTSSWPIDTENANRMRASESAVLSSTIHITCRPRPNPESSVHTYEVGDWRDVLQELPRRIHEWMPRLAEEGVAGADAIFACLGPALEIFSRYSRVEKASGETVTLKEYLECVWAAVAKEAVTIIFPEADTVGFEEDARLTAMWLWTLTAGKIDAANGDKPEEKDIDDELEGDGKKAKTAGFVLEYDAARKIAQGLGGHLEDLGSLVEVSGKTARLLPVGERARHLFGKDEGKVASTKKKKIQQLDLFQVLEQPDGAEKTFGEAIVERHGKTVLDRVHQSMILFATGRGEALRRFLVEDGAGRDQQFWRLAQALSALYPKKCDEKRWVDGLLARKKGLGL